MQVPIYKKVIIFKGYWLGSITADTCISLIRKISKIQLYLVSVDTFFSSQQYSRYILFPNNDKSLLMIQYNDIYNYFGIKRHCKVENTDAVHYNITYLYGYIM